MVSAEGIEPSTY